MFSPLSLLPDLVEVRPSVGRTPNAGAVGPKAGFSQQLSGHTAQATEGMKQQIRIKAYLLVLGLTHRVSGPLGVPTFSSDVRTPCTLCSTANETPFHKHLQV